MLIKDWLTSGVITILADETIFKVSNLMKEKGVRCLPVLNSKGVLEGIVTDLDLSSASPSKATTLDVFELNYLLSNVKIDTIMTKKVITVKLDHTIEFAAALMLENKISHLPVLDDDGGIVGIVSQTDIFKALVKISGVYEDGCQFAFALDDRPGSIKEVSDVIRSHGGRLMSIFTHVDDENGGSREVYIRIKRMAADNFAKLTQELNSKFKILYCVEDTLDELRSRSGKN